MIKNISRGGVSVENTVINLAIENVLKIKMKKKKNIRKQRRMKMKIKHSMGYATIVAGKSI